MSLRANTDRLAEHESRGGRAPLGAGARSGDAGRSRTLDEQSPPAAWRRAWRAVRAPHWWYFTPLPLTSLVEGIGGPEDVLRGLASMFVTAACLAYAYGLNGIADRAMDRNAAKNSLAGVAGVPREAALLVAACAIGAIAVAAALSGVALAGAVVSLVAGTFYSSLLRLKRLPVIGTIVNVLIFAPLPLLAVVGEPSAEVLFLTYCFWVLVTQNQILHEVSDADEDEPAGVRTTGVVVGTTGVRLLAVILGPLSILPLWWLQIPMVGRVVAAVGMCGGAVMVASCTRAHARKLRFSHRWYSLLCGMTLFALLFWGSGL